MGVGVERSADRNTRADLNHDGDMKSECYIMQINR